MTFNLFLSKSIFFINGKIMVKNRSSKDLGHIYIEKLFLYYNYAKMNTVEI